MRVTLNALATLPRSALVQFDSLGDAMAQWQKMSGREFWAENMGSDFYGYESAHDVARYASEGKKGVADRAKALLARINAAAPATVQRVRQSRPFGRAVTGAYLSSDPFPCRARVKVKADHAPLSIVVNLASSAMTRASDLEKRGVAIAALVQRVSKVRPVRLYVASLGDVGGAGWPVAWTIEFPTTPIDTHRLAWMLSSQGLARGFGFSTESSARDWYKGECPDLSRQHGVRWAKSQSYSNDSGAGTFGADVAKHLKGDVFYIPAAGSEGAAYQQMLTDPVAWINQTVDRITV